MTYEKLLEELKDMPYLDPRIEKRVNCAGKVWSKIYLSDLDDSLQLDILDELYTDVYTKEGMTFVIKETIEDAICQLTEVRNWIVENHR